MRSSMDNVGHVREIEKRDKELGGFLTLFATLPNKVQLRVLAQIKELKEKSSTEPGEFIEEVKALASLYGVLRDSSYVNTSDSSALTFKLGEVEQAARKHITH